MPATRVRAVAPEVGGGFGVKIGAYQEDFIVAALALRLKRPVKWFETRSENFLATHHGRDQWADVEIAGDKDGRIRGLKMHVVQDLGAYPKGTDLAELTGRMSAGCYDIPALKFRSVGVYTNKMAVGAYRGAGRPEAAYYVERAIDLLADAAGLDPAEVRAILGENAAKLYGFDLAKLEPLAAQYGPTPQEIATPLPASEIPQHVHTNAFR